MNDAEQRLRADLQRMYELSLAVGNSLDPDRVCHDFASALLRQQEINYIGIWSWPEKHKDAREYQLYYAFPYSRSSQQALNWNHPAFFLEDDQSFRSYSLDDPEESTSIIEKHCDKGSAAIFRLGPLGFIRLIKDDSHFTQRELRQLRPLVEKLYIALGGAFAYKQLHTERAFLNSLIQTIPDLIWLKDLQGTYLACNNRFEQFFGAKEHQIIGKQDVDFVDPELANAFRQQDQKAVDNDTAHTNHEWITFASDHKRALLETTKTPMKTAEGELIGVLGIGHDITQLHNTQQALKVSETRFRTYFELGLIGMALLSNDCNYLQVNDYLAEMLGYQPDDLKQQTFLNFVHPADKENCQALLNQLQDEQDSFREELRLQSKEGLTVHAEIALRCQRDTDGQTDHFVAMISDISERKRAEEKLNLAASVFQHASEGVMITNEKGIIIDVNQSFSHLTGYSAEEVIGRSPSILKSGHHSETFFASMWQSLQRDGHWRGEVWNRTKNGEIYAELLNIAAVYGSDNKISHYVSIFSDITQLKEHQHELERMAHFDALTQLPNRVLLSDRLDTLLISCKEQQQLMAVAYLDLDDFKPINDQYGHDTGDMLLIEVAQRLTQSLGNANAIARLGGDEFVLLLTDLDSLHSCEKTLQQLINRLNEPFLINDHNLSISASIGVTLYPEDDSDSDTLIRHADQAMYTAKQTGRNRFHFFDPAFDRQTQDQHKAQDEIRLALKNREFVLYYQPKVNMRTGRVFGTEALIRWQHPTLNLLPPDSFLPNISSASLASELGEWVMEEAIAQLRVWRAAGLDLSTSINISAQHLQQSDFPKRLSALLAKYPEVPSAAIELEVLESAAFENIDAASEVIKQCHELGVLFALDDFGTGYSSLTYLRKLPADTLKIDRSFVMDMLQDDEDKTIVEGIIGLSQAFSRTVIAEGVETAAHGRCLLQMNCDNAQGYGIARPMSADLIPDWIAQFRIEQFWDKI